MRHADVIDMDNENAIGRFPTEPFGKGGLSAESGLIHQETNDTKPRQARHDFGRVKTGSHFRTH